MLRAYTNQMQIFHMRTTNVFSDTECPRRKRITSISKQRIGWHSFTLNKKCFQIVNSRKYKLHSNCSMKINHSNPWSLYQTANKCKMDRKERTIEGILISSFLVARSLQSFSDWESFCFIFVILPTCTGI